MYVWRNTKVRSWNNWGSGKPTCIAYSECVIVDLVIQHAMSMLHIVVCGLCDSKLFSTLFQNHTIFGKKVTEYEMYIMIFPKTSVWNISRSGSNWARYDQKWISSSTVTILRVRFSWNSIFSKDVRKMLDQIYWKSVQWEPNCSMRTDKLMDGRTHRQTDRHEEAKSLFAVLQTLL
jgi:hypothetical protein